jgi:hypothetical protein
VLSEVPKLDDSLECSGTSFFSGSLIPAAIPFPVTFSTYFEISYHVTTSLSIQWQYYIYKSSGGNIEFENKVNNP